MEYWSVAKAQLQDVVPAAYFNIWGLSVANCIIHLINIVEIEIAFPQNDRRLMSIVSDMGDGLVKQAVQSS